MTQEGVSAGYSELRLFLDELLSNQEKEENAKAENGSRRNSISVTENNGGNHS